MKEMTIFSAFLRLFFMWCYVIQQSIHVSLNLWPNKENMGRRSVWVILSSLPQLKAMLMCPWARYLLTPAVELLSGQQQRTDCTGQLWGVMCWYSRNVSRVLSGKEHVISLVLNPGQTKVVCLGIFHNFQTELILVISRIICTIQGTTSLHRCSPTLFPSLYLSLGDRKVCTITVTSIVCCILLDA